MRAWMVLSAVALAAAIGFGKAEAQVSFGGQFSLTNLGTDAAKVGETIGVGGRLGFGVPIREGAKIVVEVVGDALFPPCETLSCDLYGGQLNVLAMLDYDESSRIYGGLGFAYQDYSLEDDADGTSVEGDGWGGNLIIGLAWKAVPQFEPFFEIRLSAMRDMRNQASGQIGFRIIPGA